MSLCKKVWHVFLVTVLLFAGQDGFAHSIMLNKRNAEVWYFHQTITGSLVGFQADSVKIFQGQKSFYVKVEDGDFTFSLTLEPGENIFWAEAYNGDLLVRSAQVGLTLMYRPAPLVVPKATKNGDKILLHALILNNPRNETLKYWWRSGKKSVADFRVIDAHKQTASILLPEEHGTFYVDLAVISGKDTTWFQTFFSVDSQGVKVFSIEHDHAAWIDDAVMYEITPYKFVPDGTFRDITNKLSEIKELGINTIWLQPIMASAQRGQGYDVVDYFSVNPSLGTVGDLEKLIHTAHGLGFRVLFDIVLNHTSIQHPYAQDYLSFGDGSHYKDFYQHEFDGVPYSSFYNKDENGFVCYFWKKLVNLNYNSEEVRQWMIEACKYWVREFDIDGYRFDAIWGVNARAPSFGKRLRIELKSIKPDILLLAEDKAADPEVYNKGFDAAYDWTADTAWVSQSTWQYEYHERENKTVFNFPKTHERSAMLYTALFKNGNPENLRLRYMENNDLPRFIKDHCANQTRMVAGLLFALPGIPMIYNGQEIGYPIHPYSRGDIYQRDLSIQLQDTTGLFNYYQKLIALRKQYPALTGANIEHLPLPDQPSLFAFRRWVDDEGIYVVMNLDSVRTSVPVRSIVRKPLGSGKFRDILSGRTQSYAPLAGQRLIDIEGFSIQWLISGE